MKYKIIFVFIVLILSLNIKAENNKSHNSNHATHVHGLAILTLAIEDNMLEIQLESPAMNLLGFEHRANTPEEVQKVEKLETLLNSPEKLFSIIGTQCEQKEITVDTSGVMNNEHEHLEHTEEHHPEEHHENHSEVIAHYLFSCEKVKNLTDVSTRLFEFFPAIEKINAMWVTQSKQGAAILSTDNHTLHLR